MLDICLRVKHPRTDICQRLIYTTIPQNHPGKMSVDKHAGKQQERSPVGEEAGHGHA